MNYLYHIIFNYM